MAKGKNREKQSGAETPLSSSEFVEFTDLGVMQSAFGESDKNIRTVENALDVKISRDGNGITIEGNAPDVELAKDLFVQIRDLIRNGDDFFPGDINRAITLLSGNRRAKLTDLLNERVKIPGRNKSITPKSFNQKRYIEAIQHHDVVFGVGPAGTGKTYLAMAVAVMELMKKKFKRLILCRPAVEAGEKLGFLPGDMAEKVNPYLRPLYDALHDMVDFERAQEMIDKGIIEVAPLAFMRGRTLSDAFVVLDEAQNTTSEQMKMFLTRIGFGSKCVVTGDITQIDLPRGTKSGMVEAVNILKSIKGIAFVYFSKGDVVRHPLVSKIVEAYEKADEEPEE